MAKFSLSIFVDGVLYCVESIVEFRCQGKREAKKEKLLGYFSNLAVDRMKKKLSLRQELVSSPLEKSLDQFATLHEEQDCKALF